MDQIEKVKGKIDAIKKQKEELIEELRGEIWPIFRHIFENSEGQIKQLSWPQYTDHWNDGEECTFSVHTDIDYNILINGESVEENKTYQDRVFADRVWIPNPDCNLLLRGLIEEFVEILEMIPSEFMKDLFGDHVLVTINNNGTITTEEYEHD